MITPLTWLGDLGARLAAHPAGHARQDGDALSAGVSRSLTG